jgi:hypothetical protein
MFLHLQFAPVLLCLRAFTFPQGGYPVRLRWPNSLLLVLLHFVDPNVLSGHEPVQEGYAMLTLIHQVSALADPSDYSTHDNQLTLAKQLIKCGANVNAVSRPQGSTTLHHACTSGVVTNLDFVELLLEAGADPNALDVSGYTPLLKTFPFSPNAAKLLLKWDSTDVNITNTLRGEESFLATVRAYPEKVLPHDHEREFMLEQWHDVEEMLVKRGAR